MSTSSSARAIALDPLRILLAALALASLAALVALVPRPASAQVDSAAVEPGADEPGADEQPLDSETLEDLDRQLDASEGAESDLWEDYQRYSDRKHDRDRAAGEYRAQYGERVKIGDTVVVHEDEEINGDVVAIGGDVYVRGKVDGDVVSVGGSVYLEGEAYVDGDAVAVGGSVETADAAAVTGEVVSVDLGFGFRRALHFDSPFRPRPYSRFLDLTMFLIFLLAWLGFALLFYAVAGKRIEVASKRIENEPGQTFLVGLLGAVVTPMAVVVATILLAVTVIGILFIPVLLILLALVAVGGFTAVSLAVGRRLAHARETGDTLTVVRSPYLYLTVGFVALEALFLLSKAVHVIPGLGPIAGVFGVLGVIVALFASILGYGAILTSRFGTDPSPAPAAAYAQVASGPPPPPPGAPPAGSPPPEPPPAAPPPEAAPGPEPPDEERRE